MENHQSGQQQSLEVSTSPPELKTSTPSPQNLVQQQLQAQFKCVQDFITERPLVFWSGLTGTLIAMVAVSILSLTDAGRVEQQELDTTLYAPIDTPIDTPIVAEKPISPPASEPVNPIPTWLLAILALSCAGGTLVIYNSLSNREQQPRRRSRPMPRKTVRVATSRRQAPPRPAKQQSQISAPKAVPNPTVPVAVAEELVVPVVTVLPPQENHPLDQGEQSLADMLDIRKQRSLSSLLRH